MFKSDRETDYFHQGQMNFLSIEFPGIQNTERTVFEIHCVLYFWTNVCISLKVCNRDKSVRSSRCFFLSIRCYVYIDIVIDVSAIPSSLVKRESRSVIRVKRQKVYKFSNNGTSSWHSVLYKYLRQHNKGRRYLLKFIPLCAKFILVL